MEYMEKNCTPVTRFDMLNMKANEDEKKRWDIIANIVIHFYRDAIKFAKTSTETKFTFSTKENCYGGEKFIKDNKDDIISTLKKYFINCDIQFRTYSRGGNRNMVDITDMNEVMLKCFEVDKNETMIIMTWD
tara:strand:- start:7673 stop:8068 length:396 start_codon:yes stop_codon:yes gene_type:complete